MATAFVFAVTAERQVGLVGEGRNHVEFHRWIQLDLAYIDNWSLWLDCKIFFRTIPIVITGKGAY